MATELLRSALAALAALAVLAGCGPAETLPTAPAPNPGGPVGGRVLARGSLPLAAADDPDDPAFHTIFVVDHQLPEDLGATQGRTLALALRDLTRPGMACVSEDRESGCATVDWSDEPSTPGTGPGGVLLNLLRAELASGLKELYLSRTFTLADVPDVADTQRRTTAIGGAPRRWERTLPVDLVAGSGLRLRLVMTKWQDPSVRIGYEVLLLD